MAKLNHDAKDFVTALNLDKNEIIDAVEPGFRKHIQEHKSISECILEIAKKLKKGRKHTDNELKMFAAGMVLSTALSGLRGGDVLNEFIKSSKKDKEDGLTFNSEDLLKSIRDEMDGQKS